MGQSEKKALTPQEIQKRKKMLVYPLFFLVFLGAMWLIFAPSKKEELIGYNGFNDEIPLPKENELFNDKRDAYEQETWKNKQKQKSRFLNEFDSLLDSKNDFENDFLPEEESKTFKGNNPPEASIKSSTDAYRDINQQLQSWYEQPAVEVDEQAELELQWRVQELERKLEQANEKNNQVDEQFEIMERAYEMAAKYMPNQQENTSTSSELKNTSYEKVIPKPVGQISHNVVSMLSAPLSDSAFVAEFSKPRNMGFHTVGNVENENRKNTIRASVHQTITLTDGKELQIRLTEPINADGQIIPAGTLLVGTAKINGERMTISISAIEHAGNIIPVSMQVYDTQGMQGLFIPDSDEINAIKEVAANAGANLNSSINISQQSAGQQLATDFGRGLIQGTSQYLSKKIRTVRVTVKSGHQVLLLPKQ